MITVLVVDDSALMRKHLSDLLKRNGLRVFTAANGQEAVDQVLAHEPDVITLDINMPQMDGLTALSLIMAARPTPVIMVSSLTTKGALSTLEALALGAVDFVAKPGGTISLSIDSVSGELVNKVRSAAKAKPKPISASISPATVRPGAKPAPKPTNKAKPRLPGVVVIGVSTGGPRTLEEILPSLPADLAWPVVVAQHMPASFTAHLASRLNTVCRLTVCEARQFEPLESGSIYIAKGGTDLALTRRNGTVVTVNRPESPKYLWHPSVDVLVSTAMEVLAPEQVIGVQLTGMGDDGGEAMARLKRRGGRTIAESEETAVVFGMPKDLIERGGATCVLPSNKVSDQIVRWLS